MISHNYKKPESKIIKRKHGIQAEIEEKEYSSYSSYSDDNFEKTPFFNEIPIESVQASDFSACIEAIEKENTFPVFCETSLSYLISLLQNEEKSVSDFATDILLYAIEYNIFELGSIVEEIKKNPITGKSIRFLRKSINDEDDCKVLIAAQIIPILMSNIAPSTQTTIDSLRLVEKMTRKLKEPFLSLFAYLQNIINAVFFEPAISYAALKVLRAISLSSDTFCTAIFNNERFTEILDLFLAENPDEKQRESVLYLLEVLFMSHELSYKANQEKYEEYAIIARFKDQVAIEETESFYRVLGSLLNLCSNDLLIRKLLIESGFVEALLENVFNGSFSFKYKRKVVLIFAHIACLFEKETVEYMLSIGLIDVLKFGLLNHRNRDVELVIEALDNIIELGIENGEESFFEAIFGDSELIDLISDINEQLSPKDEKNGVSQIVCRARDILFRMDLYEKGELT